MNARDVRIRLGRKEVLRGVDLAIPQGALTLLAGRNGAGKSTLLAILAGIRRPDAGEVAWEGRELRGLAHRERARLVTLIPQEAETSFDFTGRELVRLGRHPWVPSYRGFTSADDAIAGEALRQADAEAFADRSVLTLSGGERRRISIARALATQAQVLLADEPTGNLDLEHALQVLELFRELARAGRTVVVASHDLNLVAPFAEHVVLLHEGRVFAAGSPASVLTDDAIRTVFGVECVSPPGVFPKKFERRGSPGGVP
jgi:iron complex transport system ATP-binding protein